jgi:hypothetical protein
MGISTFPAASAGGVTQKVLRYTTPGLSTFTLPSGFSVDNPLMAEVTILGGGGSAGCGYWSSSSAGGVTGGGGGGGIFNSTIPLTENMNVMVGRGGGVLGNLNYNQDGGNGGISYIGNGTPKNLFINPTFGGFEASKPGNEFSVAVPFSSTNIRQSEAAAISGSSATAEAVTNSVSGLGQMYPVLPSTNYAFSMYFRTENNTSNYRLLMEWYDSSGIIISTTTGTTTTVTTSWGRIEVGAASPSTAAYARLRWQYVSSNNLTYISNAMFESGTTTASTYVDGYTAGYSWAGHPFGSVTLLNTETMYVANGGGGGKGIQTTQNYSLHGFAGACSGGGGFFVNSSTNYYSGGAGGGLGGNAERTFTTLPSGSDSTSITFNVNAFEYNKHREFSSGTIGLEMSNNAGRLPGTSIGGPANFEGYGAGGYGSQHHATNGTGYINSTETISAPRVNKYRETIVSGKNNTGAGGSVTNFKFSDNNPIPLAGFGGSGLVVIKYWS